MANFINSDRSQAFLLPPDLRDWLPEDDLAHFVIAAAERVDLSLFKINDRGSGKAQYHPQMMLALLIYGYANGSFSSRRLERSTYRDIGVRFVAANSKAEIFDIVSQGGRGIISDRHETGSFMLRQFRKYP